MMCIQYSGTSLQTPRIKDTIEKTFIIRTKTFIPTGLVNTILPLKEENFYITAKSGQKFCAPKCPQ